MASTECVHVDINVFPTPPPPPPPKTTIPEKLLKIMRQYKYNWRIDQLSKPKLKSVKFLPKIWIPRRQKIKPLKISEESKYYSDQQSRPLLRQLVINKQLFGKQNGRVYLRKISKNIKKSWGSIYNFYKKQERDRRLRQLRREGKGASKNKKPKEFKRIVSLAQPKPKFLPEPVKKTSKIFANYGHLDVLASPKPYVLEPPKRLGVNPAALTYQPTEIVIRLAEVPARFKNQPKPLEPGKVQRGALRYKITPRTEELAVPKQRSEKAKVDEDYDPWAISKNALKYKPTPRILELAKPVERE